MLVLTDRSKLMLCVHVRRLHGCMHHRGIRCMARWLITGPTVTVQSS
jgi:hypothetical protein